MALKVYRICRPVATSLWSSYRLQVLRNHHHTAAKPFRPRLDSVTEEPEEDELTVLSSEISKENLQRSTINGSICCKNS
ncbi:unnamed protein product, partial [Mesorhabditis belari]|uniref:Uncharacterized protein n=1 Tax=Mesorhabditis belari TaxID=2138241 RepID=A0AAF3EH07_9BILA